jgi:thiamine biosynthesis lipoprotein
LNKAAGKWVSVSQTLWEVLQAAWEAIGWTDGLVTPTILPALESAGYDRSFEKIRNDNGSIGNHSSREKDPSGLIINWKNVEFDVSKRRVRMPEGMRLDLGGFGKGWAADQACQRLAGFGPTLVEAGGDIALSARLAGESPWRIAINHPTQMQDGRYDHSADYPDRPGCNRREFVTQGPAGVAASGNAFRNWGNGDQMHHLIDPRTGRPAASDLLQVSVLAETALKAEIAAKAAFILGCQSGRTWLEQNHLEGCLLCQDGTVILTT